MLSFEQVGEILDEEAGRLPSEIFKGLNGGIVLLPDTVRHPEGTGGDLFILGKYIYQPGGLGRYIAIYYGSFAKVCGHERDSVQQKRIIDVLRHELTHHLEHMAGDRSLEEWDEREMEKYKSRKRDRTGSAPPRIRHEENC